MLKKHFLILYIISLINYNHQLNYKLFELKGYIFGTYYKIKYLGYKNFTKEINNIFTNINKTCSIYDSNSSVSKINKGFRNIYMNKYFKYLIIKSKKIYLITNGAFDPTLGIISLKWGFHNTKLVKYDKNIYNKQLGLNKILLINKKIYIPKGLFIDFNGIAKGYTIDLISELFKKKNINNYLIEIGGEIKVKGENENNQIWRIGIENPNIKSLNNNKILLKILLKNKSIATSGSYRNFIKKKNIKYSHIINNITKKPNINNNLLSVSVISDSCGTADAYATSFMSIGIKKSIKLIKKYPKIITNAIFIYISKNKKIKYIFL